MTFLHIYFLIYFSETKNTFQNSSLCGQFFVFSEKKRSSSFKDNVLPQSVSLVTFGKKRKTFDIKFKHSLQVEKKIL